MHSFQTTRCRHETGVQAMSDGVPALDERQKRHLQWKKYPKMEPAVPMIPLDIDKESEVQVDTVSVMKKALANPLVPLGMAATVVCLVGMFRATLNRNQYRAQLYMRGRCAAQGFTVLALVGGALAFGWDPSRYSKKPQHQAVETEGQHKLPLYNKKWVKWCRGALRCRQRVLVD
ncbi:hypothetical protein QR680_004045 [Steinernema hermaphroditum]|uniref:HIG1 domain-containing protein n=1 Tax=Steinernema hermaphroditum TaxID=289476 RepID=A0AA39HMH4_9BILA|nr:hypothetical protein QR680_004045 [Steinernema hermaphroditum]